jgi:hypothetical protein
MVDFKNIDWDISDTPEENYWTPPSQTEIFNPAPRSKQQYYRNVSNNTIRALKDDIGTFNFYYKRGSSKTPTDKFSRQALSSSYKLPFPIFNQDVSIYGKKNIYEGRTLQQIRENVDININNNITSLSKQLGVKINAVSIDHTKFENIVLRDIEVPAYDYHQSLKPEEYTGRATSFNITDFKVGPGILSGNITYNNWKDQKSETIGYIEWKIPLGGKRRNRGGKVSSEYKTNKKITSWNY